MLGGFREEAALFYYQIRYKLSSNLQREDDDNDTLDIIFSLDLLCGSGSESPAIHLPTVFLTNYGT